MRPRAALVIAAIVLFSITLAPICAQEVKIDIPYNKFILDNGLTVIVHEDHKAPIVAVNIWYHVGSKNEKRGKTGFAHLFEHLMFNGSEHFNQDYFKVLEKIGATDLNGTTNNDRTNYFQNVPTSALDTVLWMESDRMGYMIKAIDQGKLDEQRGVVQNEKRQGDNQPYGRRVWTTIVESTYPASHPYSWDVIGSMDDLNAASLKDVHEWFQNYYGPSNAVLVLAGDIDAKTARDKVQKYFGALPPGPPVIRHQAWIAKMQGSHRAVMEDRVPQSRLYKVWNVPPASDRDSDLLQMAGRILGGGKSSRLYKRLVYNDQSATDVAVFTWDRELSSQFMVMATAKPGGDLAQVEKAADEEVQRFLKDGPTPAELERARTAMLADFLRGVERIGGFGGKSDVLAEGAVFMGDPEHYKDSLKNIQQATPEALKKAANAWLSDGVFALEVHPFGTPKAAVADADRAKMPDPSAAPAPKLPKAQRATLSNGLKVLLAERHETPIVEMNLLVDAGYAADQFATPGTARLALAVMREGTKTRTSTQINEQLEALGAQLYAYSTLDSSMVIMNALKAKLDDSLALFEDVAVNPAFPQKDFEREQRLLLAAIEREKVQPVNMGLRVFPGLLYGPGHAYANPLTGSGTPASVKSISRESLAKFHETWFHPNNATLVVAGDTTLAEIQPKLEKLFALWRAGTPPKKNIPAVSLPTRQSVYIIDRPDSVQSIVMAGHIATPKSDPDQIATDVLNNLLGGMFISRINMNLREDKHWSYGAGSLLWDARGQRPFFAYTSVQSDKTKETMVEIAKEMRDIISKRPVTGDELKGSQDNMTLSLPGSRETTGAVAGSFVDVVQYGLPDDYWQTYPNKVRELNTADIARVAERLIHPDSIIWVVVGDKAKIEAGIKELNFGEIRYLDADGNKL